MEKINSENSYKILPSNVYCLKMFKHHIIFNRMIYESLIVNLRKIVRKTNISYPW